MTNNINTVIDSIMERYRLKKAGRFEDAETYAKMASAAIDRIESIDELIILAERLEALELINFGYPQKIITPSPLAHALDFFKRKKIKNTRPG